MSAISELLLPWFKQNGRKDLPWQVQPDAYRVWLSEIMLQQTQVTTVIPYFERFVASFPGLKQLADASLDEVLQHWAGLGYYARARNLHKTAIIVRDEYQGELPTNLDDLVVLPGIGRSTAGAILSLAHGQYAPILDGNVKRVLARVYQVEGWPGKTATMKQLWSLAEEQTPPQNVNYYNQAIMDLGAMVCRRTSPACDACPLTTLCGSFESSTQALYPESRPKKNRPHRHRWLLLHQHENRLLLERRPPQGIWGGLWSLPELETLDQLEQWQTEQLGFSQPPIERQENLLRHQFSHFDLSISVAYIHLTANNQRSQQLQIRENDDRQWINREQLAQYGLPAPVLTILSNG